MNKLIVFFLLLFPLLNSFSQSKKEIRKERKLEQFNISKVLIESRNYEFVAIKASPLRGGLIDMYSNPNFLRVKDTIAEADMPFFGEGYNVSYGGPGGIKFNKKMDEYEVKINEKKSVILISFKVREAADLYECEFKIFSRDNVSLHIKSWQRDAITYNGMINPIIKKE
jgi:hypothetical protein